MSSSCQKPSGTKQATPIPQSRQKARKLEYESLLLHMSTLQCPETNNPNNVAAPCMIQTICSHGSSSLDSQASQLGIPIQVSERCLSPPTTSTFFQNKILKKT
jgi:hypothetical protein